jgi:hypothetical protein
MRYALIRLVRIAVGLGIAVVVLLAFGKTNDVVKTIVALVIMGWAIFYVAFGLLSLEEQMRRWHKKRKPTG